MQSRMRLKVTVNDEMDRSTGFSYCLVVHCYR